MNRLLPSYATLPESKYFDKVVIDWRRLAREKLGSALARSLSLSAAEQRRLQSGAKREVRCQSPSQEEILSSAYRSVNNGVSLCCSGMKPRSVKLSVYWFLYCFLGRFYSASYYFFIAFEPVGLW